jgi:hypothetical protein
MHRLVVPLNPQAERIHGWVVSAGVLW